MRVKTCQQSTCIETNIKKKSSIYIKNGLCVASDPDKLKNKAINLII